MGGAESRGALAVYLDRAVQPEKRFFAHGPVLAAALDFEQTSIGLKADLPQCGQITQPFADGKVSRVVDRGLGPRGDFTHLRDLFEILLDAGVLVIHVQRWDYAFGQHAGAEAPGCSLGHPAIEQELHHVGPPDVEILADDLLEQDTPVQWPVQNLSEREFRLQDGDIVPVAGLAVLWRKRMWQTRQPAA